MPVSSVDTFLACSLMLILIVSAMAGMTKILQPYISHLANGEEGLWHRRLCEYLLLSSGTPQNWGEIKESNPSTLGLASLTQKPYELNPDKISRLNSENIYSLTYQEILKAFGTSDFSLNIKVHPLFEVSINLTASHIEGATTTYTFKMTTAKSGYTLATALKCYITLETYISTISTTTDQNGTGYVNVTLPNSLSGPALLVTFAKAETYSQVMSFNAYTFSHNNPDTPEPNKTFLQLSPIEQTLTASLQKPNLTVQNAYVFTYNYQFDLPQITSENQTLEYRIPKLLEASPVIFVLNGNNASNAFTEWCTYPQVPLEIGADFNDLTSKSNTIAQPYIVSINSIFYESIITLRRATS